MELEQYVNSLQDQLVVAAQAGGEEARALAERLTAPLHAAVRLTLLDSLSAAVAEITRELAPGSVELRLRGGEPEFAVSAPPADPGGDAEGGTAALRAGGDAWPAGGAPPASGAAGERGLSRVNLRLPDQLKARVEQAADREGLSINAWLVRATAAGVERAEAGSRVESDRPRGGRRYTGWGR